MIRIPSAAVQPIQAPVTPAPATAPPPVETAAAETASVPLAKVKVKSNATNTPELTITVHGQAVAP